METSRTAICSFGSFALSRACNALAVIALLYHPAAAANLLLPARPTKDSQTDDGIPKVALLSSSEINSNLAMPDKLLFPVRVSYAQQSEGEDPGTFGYGSVA
jgi:hypothetical protein